MDTDPMIIVIAVVSAYALLMCGSVYIHEKITSKRGKAIAKAIALGLTGLTAYFEGARTTRQNREVRRQRIKREIERNNLTT